MENLEGQYFLRGHNLTNLSVEQIVDCDGTQADDNSENADCGVYGGIFLVFKLEFDKFILVKLFSNYRLAIFSIWIC